MNAVLKAILSTTARVASWTVMCTGSCMFFLVCLFLILPPEQAKQGVVPIAIAIVGGALATTALHSMQHAALRARGFALERSRSSERVWWIPVLIGLYERGMIVLLVAFDVGGAASFVAGWMALKVAMGWKDWSAKGHEGRARIFAASITGGVSALSGLVGGLMLKVSLN